MTADEIMSLADDFATRLKELCGLFSNDHPAASMRQREFIRDFAPKAQPKVDPVQEPVPQANLRQVIELRAALVTPKTYSAHTRAADGVMTKRHVIQSFTDANSVVLVIEELK